jgi:hypothetical protein
LHVSGQEFSPGAAVDVQVWGRRGPVERPLTHTVESANSAGTLSAQLTLPCLDAERGVEVIAIDTASGRRSNVVTTAHACQAIAPSGGLTALADP